MGKFASLRSIFFCFWFSVRLSVFFIFLHEFVDCGRECDLKWSLLNSLTDPPAVHDRCWVTPNREASRKCYVKFKLTTDFTSALHFYEYYYVLFQCFHFALFIIFPFILFVLLILNFLTLLLNFTSTITTARGMKEVKT